MKFYTDNRNQITLAEQLNPVAPASRPNKKKASFYYKKIAVAALSLTLLLQLETNITPSVHAVDPTPVPTVTPTPAEVVTPAPSGTPAVTTSPTATATPAPQPTPPLTVFPYPSNPGTITGSTLKLMEEEPVQPE